MHRAWDAGSGAVLAERLQPAHTHWTRLKGLLGTRGLAHGDGLWLKPCRQVHMLGMRYPLDVVFLDERLVVLHTIRRLAPGKISPRIAGATSVLELPAGTLERVPLPEGGRVEIEGSPAGADAAHTGPGALAWNLLLAFFFVFLASAHLRAGRQTGHWLPLLPLVVLEAILVVLFLLRRAPQTSSTRPLDWVLGFSAVCLPLFLRPVRPPGALVWLGGPVQVAGLLLAIAAVLSLGRSLGVVAANRGVRSGGLYRFVRHPLYTAELLTVGGYLASFPSARNAIIGVAFLAVLPARALVEERLLGADAAYAAYARRTPWRFVPFVY